MLVGVLNDMQKRYKITYSDTVYADSVAEATAKFKDVFHEFEIEELFWRGGPFQVFEIE